VFRVGGEGDQGHGPLGDGRTLANWWSTAAAPVPSPAPAKAAKTPAEPAEYLSLAELASYSGISGRKLRALKEDPLHPLACFKIGGKFYFRRSDFDAWAAKYRRVGNPNVNRLMAELFPSKSKRNP